MGPLQFHLIGVANEKNINKEQIINKKQSQVKIEKK
jgi:hypothetical protein